MSFLGGNPWPFYVPTNPFGTFAAFSGSWGIWFKSNFTWKIWRLLYFFSLSLGSKKLRFVHTTKLSSECMWKAHKSAGKMRRSSFQCGHLTLTYIIFHVNRNTFPEFSQFLYQQFSTFHSPLVVNYPSQASFERNWMFLTVFLVLSACWIVSAGPSGHLKQSVQKTFFEQRWTSWISRCWNSTKVFHCRHTVDKRVARCYLKGFVSEATPKLWPKSENQSKNHQIWNNFGPRSPTVGGRGRPPFVEDIANCHTPHCLSLGGRLFLRNFGTFRSGKGPAPSP